MQFKKRDSSVKTSITGFNSDNKYETISIIPKDAKAVNYIFNIISSKFISKIITEKENVNSDIESMTNLSNF